MSISSTKYTARFSEEPHSARWDKTTDLLITLSSLYVSQRPYNQSEEEVRDQQIVGTARVAFTACTLHSAH